MANGIYQLSNYYVWLAGPNAYGGSLWLADYDDANLDSYDVNYSIALRPVVAIPHKTFDESYSLYEPYASVPTASGNITLSPNTSDWTNGNVTVTATYANDTAKSYPVQFKVGSEEFTDGTAKGDGSGYTVTVSENCTVFARLRNNPASGGDEKYGALASLTITKIDKTPPTDTAPTVNGNGGNSVQIKFNQVDAESGIPSDVAN